MKHACGSGPLNAFIIDGPNAFPGNTFRISTPNSKASTASFTVIIPGITGTLYLLHIFTVSGLKLGLTTYFAPAKITILAVSGSNTVPAPIITSGFDLYFSDSSFIISTAPGTVIVISIKLIPPFTILSIIFSPCSLLSARTTATTFSSFNFAKISNLSIITSLFFCLIYHI